MKRFFPIVLAALLASGCNSTNDTESEAVKNLRLEKEAAIAEVAKKDSSIVAFMESMNQIQGSMDSVKAIHKILTLSSSDVEFRKTQPEQIVDDIGLLNEMLAKNKNAIANLTKKLKKSNLKISEFEKMIARMETQISEKDAEIEILQAQLASQSTAMKVLFNEYNDRISELGNLTKQINTAYYAFGTSKELKGNGVISKDGGFAGVGRNSKMSADFNKKYFTKVDITELKEIPLSVSKAELLTSHPSDSYTLEKVGKKIEKLTILNAEEFWSVSKYLVIVVD